MHMRGSFLVVLLANLLWPIMPHLLLLLSLGLVVRILLGGPGGGDRGSRRPARPEPRIRPDQVGHTVTVPGRPRGLGGPGGSPEPMSALPTLVAGSSSASVGFPSLP